ncbi:MAG TPA: heavy metal translocating P-type ATPase [Gemmatimonadaceae bacterium]|nr:heavy metal translocating P-type ATPase [Gemmatimonadaceae bacterium]
MRWHDVGMVVLVVSGAPLVWRTARHAVHGRFATDIVATLAILTAIVLRQPLAGLVIVAMQSGGELLERYAARRASRALDELEDASPHIAHRAAGDVVEDVAADEIQIGDELVVRPGELVPVDGVVESGTSWIDASRLTGESLPVDVEPGAKLMSGSVNGARPLRVRATARALESQYAKIVDLVRSAQASKAPLQRLADRYAIWFTPLTLLICGLTFALARDWTRVLAVLVVATPCPLILATPVAIVGGISHAARHRIIVRHGGAMETLSRVTVAVFDKTGTLTIGRPAVSRVVTAKEWSEPAVLRLAAAVEQGSGHLLARSIVSAAERVNGGIPSAAAVTEVPGRGVTGVVAGHAVAVGARSFVREQDEAHEAPLREFEQQRGSEALRAFVLVDGKPAGAIEFADEIRPNIGPTFERMRRTGVHRMLLLSGDHPAYVNSVAAAVGIEGARGNLLPVDKVEVVAQLRRAGECVLMVGDGVNDAPALSTADVGVALAAHGRGLASESADVILLEDDIASVAEAVEIGHKTIRVARQSIMVGLGLSSVAMVFAAYGMIAPVMGAALQEAIDVAVILNALRTSR